MSSTASRFTGDETGVFWDMVDCPIPKDLCPKSIFLKIKSALNDIGYLGNISISAYSVMDQNPKDFESTRITLLPTVSGNQLARRDTILGDVLEWSFERKHIPFNLLIISHEIKDDYLYVKALMFLKDRTGNILLAQPQSLVHDELSKVLLSHVTTVWRWKSLSYGEKPFFIPGRKQLVSQLAFQ